MSAAEQAEARTAIIDVLARYARSLDRRDFVEFAACFTADATAEYDGVRLERGVDAIVAHVRRVEHLHATTHLFGLPVIDVDGDEASAEVGATAMLVGGGTIQVRGLRYRHRLMRSEGRWRIADLVHSLHWAFDVPARTI
jgi:uncharacterized protein (TIGR02246 family)